MAYTLDTPRVIINEVNAFPNSVVAVATAVPAFIGYTRRADYKGKSYLNEPVKISSLTEFLIFFGASSDPQYQPIYLPVLSKGTGEVTIGVNQYDILPDPKTIYYLYNSIKLFYQNGGGDCYIVSVGLIGPAPAAPKAMAVDDPLGLVNPNVDLDALQKGLKKLLLESAPTMIVIPDGLLLGQKKYATLMQSVLKHCRTLQSRVGIFDVFGGEAPDPETWKADDIEPFREGVGMNELKYGIAYYPFLKTTITQDGDVNYNTLGGAKALNPILPVEGNDPLKSLLGQIADVGTNNGPTALQVENGLLEASSDYKQLHKHVLEKINILPPSAAMAGVYTAVDSTQGVWKAPANVSLSGVVDTTLSISDQTQGPLNVDAATGKSINAIRKFPGLGVIVWGARTLDGNSQDWRYVNVRRTVIMIEESVKLAARAYVFAPNVAGTWSLINSMLSSFLANLWAQGALAGATSAAAFDVAVGLGTTMTADDILNGIMNITVRVAVSHPAEFIVITVSQKQQTS
jgi:phage tail sheath protein FI